MLMKKGYKNRKNALGSFPVIQEQESEATVGTGLLKQCSFAADT